VEGEHEYRQEATADYGSRNRRSYFPGLAIAEMMSARGWEVSWLGTSAGMESDIVPKRGIALDKLDFTGMRGKGLKHTLTGAWKLMRSLNSCWKILGKRKPDVVIGMGGYVTVPGGNCLAAS
jgi:UDP-N-acetylglucosamine--N-acetylmuramyl-(pentapeptide) pyrophosphoryl-undecaprenol N-acetylglucosamine transferase